MDKRYYIEILKNLGDDRGGLNVIEGTTQVPFEIKRVFYNYNTDSSWIRGNHANINSKFAFVSIVGSCVVEVDDGEHKEAILLDSPEKMLVIDKMVWKVMKDYSEDNVLLILSDHVYDSREYVNAYENFQTLLAEKGEK